MYRGRMEDASKHGKAATGCFWKVFFDPLRSDEKQRSCEWIAIVQANPINQVNQSGKKNPDAAEDAAPPIGTGGPTGSLHVLHVHVLSTLELERARRE